MLRILMACQGSMWALYACEKGGVQRSLVYTCYVS